MLISLKHGFTFLCVSKSASTSIEHAIRGYCDIVFSGHPKVKHVNAQTYSDNILPLLPSPQKIESFCVMRPPLEWLESWYRYRSRNELMSPEHPNHKNYTGNVSYNEFVKAYLSKGIRPHYARLASQYRFMQLKNGEIGVDRIFTIDRMDLVSQYLSNKVGEKVFIDFENRSPQKSIELDQTLKKNLQDHLAHDIALYKAGKQSGELTRKSINAV